MISYYSCSYLLRLSCFLVVGCPVFLPVFPPVGPTLAVMLHPPWAVASRQGIFRVPCDSDVVARTISSPLRGGERLLLGDCYLRLSPTPLKPPLLLLPIRPQVVSFSLKHVGKSLLTFSLLGEFLFPRGTCRPPPPPT